MARTYRPRWCARTSNRCSECWFLRIQRKCRLSASLLLRLSPQVDCTSFCISNAPVHPFPAVISVHTACANFPPYQFLRSGWGCCNSCATQHTPYTRAVSNKLHFLTHGHARNRRLIGPQNNSFRRRGGKSRICCSTFWGRLENVLSANGRESASSTLFARSSDSEAFRETCQVQKPKICADQK